VRIYTDNGTSAYAYKKLDGDAGWDTDCHGTTFAFGQLWIDDNEVETILAGDGYSQISKGKLKVGDIVVYRDKDGNVVHSMTVVSIDPNTGEVIVYGQGGLEVLNYNIDINKAWTAPGTKQTYYTKKTDQKKSDPQKTGPKKPDPQKPDQIKHDPKKPDPKKSEPKKPDPQK
jgi:hypothetical protein